MRTITYLFLCILAWLLVLVVLESLPSALLVLGFDTQAMHLFDTVSQICDVVFENFQPYE